MFSVLFPYGMNEEVGDGAGFEQGKGTRSASLTARAALAGGLPLLTVAQISDTSAEMIERHYGHLSRHAAAEALAGLAL